MRRLAVILVLAAALPAAAERRLAIRVDGPPHRAEPVVARAQPATIFLERCRGGCTVTYGEDDDARTYTSAVPQGPGTTFRIGEYVNVDGDRGTAADAEWAAVVQCVREVYSPYAIEVTDVRPASGSFHLAIVAGSPADVGYPGDVLGVAPLANDCALLENAVSFTFASAHVRSQRVTNVCWTVAQETAHAHGLDHVFEQVDGTSACNDPMTYRTDCGGQKFFRNVAARCGTTAPARCQCGATQNSHAALLARFGASTPLTPPPAVTLDAPTTSDGPLPATVTATASSQRGIARVELILNGTPWTSVPGAPFGSTGQPAAAYTLEMPAGLPASLFDIVVRAHEDIAGRFTDTPAITRVNGAACTADEGCLAFQRCTGGRCAWDPPAGAVGDACDYPQACTSGTCRDAVCTQACDPAGPNGPAGLAACPADFDCAADGYCAVATGGGCCSATADLRGVTPGLALVLFALRRRRRMG